MPTKSTKNNQLSFDDFKAEVLNDYRVAVTSRECSLLGRREVLTGKAKFGIFGDGKEVPQLAWAKAFKKGDWRSGYYRDQTFMMALDLLTIEQFFAGLYAHTSIEHEPMSGGRQMGGHFMTHSLNEDGSFKALEQQYNSSSDISPTAGQMPRLLGLAQASSVYRNVKEVAHLKSFSDRGQEVAWGSIGNASTSEGLFWETINAAGVLQVPLVISVWDDDYGISVHAKYQTTKENISEILKGFQREDELPGFEIVRVNGWDYADLVKVFKTSGALARENHVPVLIHVQELTQPQGHSTSGSHERYKGPERLTWEREHDCNVKMRQWILDQGIATEDALTALEADIKKQVRDGKNRAWAAYIAPHKNEKTELLQVLEALSDASRNQNQQLQNIIKDLIEDKEPLRRDLLSAARRAMRLTIGQEYPEKKALAAWINAYIKNIEPLYASNLHSEQDNRATRIKSIAPTYDNHAAEVDGRLILRNNFKALFEKHPELLIFGEDSGKIGDVNQGLEGLQEIFGQDRISDAGIREATIIGQGIGMAMRGLRPIAEIQYLDYVLYCLQTMSDDLATVRYRSNGKQKAPLIVRTRGHRLEGIWHSGSPMGGLVHLLRGLHILVPRNMTVAAGFYNTLLESDEPALVIESLNGYRLKEQAPTNYGQFRTPIGVVETLVSGSDMTVVSYGSTLRMVVEVAHELQDQDIHVEVIDAQSLLPFDMAHDVVKSLQKTNRLLIVDEDVPGGASSYLLDQILLQQNGYQYLDSKPQTLTAKAHRPAYGTDGDYFSKPSLEDIYEKIYGIMHESDPSAFPKLR
ncbi:thiamine pyrophosphate-dependent enzyme [Flavobacteriaceae bacterium]|mgnify:CR=1 FL=1|nr:thiamine pyrophosphate-dependent enzyme [Flavobacteriaceae bacterium]